MFRDTLEELKRLEAQLLAEEDAPIEEEAAEEIDDIQLEELLRSISDDGEEEVDAFDKTTVFDSSVRNYANHYKAYNTDKTDEDLDRYSEEVRNPDSNRGVLGLSIVALLLMAGILAVLVWWLVRFQGLMG